MAGPSALSFWRWLSVAVLVAPFALPRVIRLWPTIRANLWLLMALTAAGASLYQPATYLGLRYTEAINAAIFRGPAPDFVVLAAWLVEGEPMTARRWAGIALASAGMLVLAARGSLDTLLRFEVNIGDIIVLAANCMMSIYVLALKRLPPELAGLPL